MIPFPVCQLITQWIRTPYYGIHCCCMTCMSPLCNMLRGFDVQKLLENISVPIFLVYNHYFTAYFDVIVTIMVGKK